MEGGGKVPFFNFVCLVGFYNCIVSVTVLK